MKWKDLTIGKKLSIGFGLVIVLLAIISGYSYLGFARVNQLAHESKKLARDDEFMLLKLIDHLNWVSNLSDLVSKDDVTSVELETDDHHCGFGKWLYSDEVKQLAAENKEIGTLIEAIKEPHHKLHQSAIKIEDTYVAVDPALDSMLADRWIDHLMWIKDLSQAIMTGEPFKGGLDPKACAFGKWYHSYQASDPTFAELLKGWEQPHTQLHQSAQKITELLGRHDQEGARTLYQQETMPALERLAAEYKKTMGWIDANVAKQKAAQEIFHHETLPALAETRKILDAIREKYSHESDLADEQMMKSIDREKISIIALAIIATLLGVLAATFIARGINRPITKGVNFAKAMSEGDLTQTLDVNQKDEVGILAAALNAMAGNLRRMFQDILQGVETPDHLFHRTFGHFPANELRL